MRVIYRPNTRSTSQPSTPAAASGRAEGDGGAGGIEVRLGDGRYAPTAGTGANGTGPCADGCGGAGCFGGRCEKFVRKPPTLDFRPTAPGPPPMAAGLERVLTSTGPR